MLGEYSDDGRIGCNGSRASSTTGEWPTSDWGNRRSMVQDAYKLSKGMPFSVGSLMASLYTSTNEYDIQVFKIIL